MTPDPFHPSGEPADPARPAGTGLDLARVRREFPALGQSIHGHPLAYLDNAASTQKPRAVLDAVIGFYETDNANVHRGVHALGDRATARYEQARETVRRFLNAGSDREIVFVRGATEGINLVAQTFGRKTVGPGDEVVITWMEHHANIIPWQALCDEKGATLRVVPITDEGELRLDVYEKMLTPRTKIVAVSHVSNVLGTVNPVALMTAMAHAKGVPVLVDGAQAVSHLRADVAAIGCDFYTFSGHKVYGPMGVGVLYGRAELLEAMPPWQGGGDMVKTVTFQKTTYNAPPYRFEAGTPNVAGAVGLAAALDGLERLGRDSVAAHEERLIAAAVKQLATVRGVRVVGAPGHRAGAVSFVVEGPPLSALDVGARLDLAGIAVRTGHHCCQPLMLRLGLPGTVRASFALYNTFEEVERLTAALRAITSAAGGSRSAKPDVLPKDRAEGPEYPAAVRAGVEEAAEALLEEFEELGDWAERYEYLVEIGRGLPEMPDALKTEANRVRGCQSIVFLSARAKPGAPDSVEFLADSDSEIVRGLVALLQRLFSGQKAEEVVAFDLPRFLARMELDRNLTTSRRNGLAEMIKRLRGFAATLRTEAGVGGLKVAV
jgi:cysteine desulfurase / selenocysteine lyase